MLKKLESESGAKGGTARGTGGMYSKLLAAKIASDAGIETHLVKGDETNVLLEVAAGHLVGTRIRGKKR
jgi:glutamate 5-kinase